MWTALQLAEQIDLVKGKVSGKHAEEIRAALEAAEKHLRGQEKAQPMTEDEVWLMMETIDQGMEYALYMEDRGYYKVDPVIIDRRMPEDVRVMHSNGMYYLMPMREYNRTWRLWQSYPSGVERKKAEWRARR